MIVGVFELSVVPLPRPGHLADVCVDESGDFLDAIVEHADRGHGLAELLGKLPDSIEVFPQVVTHMCLAGRKRERVYGVVAILGLVDARGHITRAKGIGMCVVLV